MFGLLKTKTLATVIAELQRAEDMSWMKSRERLYLDDATMELVDRAGPEKADKMITAAKGQGNWEPTDWGVA